MITLTIEDFDLKDIFTCGQCFRWQRISDYDWIGIASAKVLRVTQEGKQVYFDCTQEEYNGFWHAYFDLGRDYGQVKNQLLERAPDLAEAIEYGSGIRLLNQDPFEMLMTFIISANNHIPRITDLVKRLSIEFGEPVSHPYEGLIGKLYAFPSAEVLAGVSVETYRALGLGYRDKYIKESAMRVVSEAELFRGLRQLDYKQAKQVLTNYSGVGPKVADCILLFSSGKYEAFPIDTWIKKTLIRRYGLSEHQPKSIQNFIETTFGDLKGFANQYLFYFERSKQV